MQQAFASGVSPLDDTDPDGNGVIDLFAGEAGIRGLPDQALTLVVAPLIRTG